MARELAATKEIEEILNFISTVSIFKDFPVELLREISIKVIVKSFAKDSTIIEKESPGNYLYMIKSGSARVIAEDYDDYEDYGEFEVANIQSGECFGEMSLLTCEPCCATVKTNEDSLLYLITKNDFDDITSKSPLIYKHFNSLLVKRVNRQNIKSTQLKEHEIALNRYLQNTKEHRYSDVVGKCKSIKKTLNEAQAFSKMEGPFTLVGESGTGKEVIARKIHMDSERGKFPVIVFTLPKERREEFLPVFNERRKVDLVECDLFGNEKISSFTDVKKRIGRFELMDKGTIIIKNIEAMPLSTQGRLLKFLETGAFSRVGGNELIHSCVRVVATTSDIHLAQKQLEASLFTLLCTHKLEVPPLSKHKKDIPFLMEHFVKKISKTKHTPIKEFSKEATNKLLKYDYPGNVKELEDIIERAVKLSWKSTIVEEEEIFLGDTDVEDKIRFNLLSIPLIKWLCKSNNMYLAVKTTTLVLFLAVLFLLLVQPEILIGERNIVLVLCWQICLPLLFVTYLFAARFGCGICPMSSISKFINKHINLKIPIPSFVKKYDTLIMGIGFVSILFIEEYTHMTSSISKTAYLVFSVLLGAIIFDFIFERSAWCRHLCPLGGMGGLFSMSSMLEIRANKNTCTTICTTHDCYKGSDNAERCPMFLHLQFLSDNRYCKFCLNCIKSCKHNATRLNLRIPGIEIGSPKHLPLTGALMAIILSGLLIAMIPSKTLFNQASFTSIFFISVILALGLFLIINFFTALITKNVVTEHIKYFGYTLLPLTLCGYIALELKEIFGNAEGAMIFLNIYEFNFNIASAIQSFFVVIGFFITEYIIYKIIKNKFEQNQQLKTFAIQGILPLTFTIIYISLFYNCNYTSYLAKAF